MISFMCEIPGLVTLLPSKDKPSETRNKLVEKSGFQSAAPLESSEIRYMNGARKFRGQKIGGGEAEYAEKLKRILQTKNTAWPQ